MKKSKLTKLLQWGERQRFIVQVAVIIPVAILVGIPIILSKRLARKWDAYIDRR